MKICNLSLLPHKLPDALCKHAHLTTQILHHTSPLHPFLRPTSKQYCIFLTVAFSLSFHLSAWLCLFICLFPWRSTHSSFLPSLVLDLLYWRDVGTTGLVFTGLVVGLACLFQLSAITILSNLGLGIMAFTLPVRFLYKAMALVRLSDGSHPFQWVCYKTTRFSTQP